MEMAAGGREKVSGWEGKERGGGGRREKECTYLHSSLRLASTERGGEILIVLFIAIGYRWESPIKVISVSDRSSTANKSYSCVGSTRVQIPTLG